MVRIRQLSSTLATFSKMNASSKIVMRGIEDEVDIQNEDKILVYETIHISKGHRSIFYIVVCSASFSCPFPFYFRCSGRHDFQRDRFLRDSSRESVAIVSYICVTFLQSGADTHVKAVVAHKRDSALSQSRTLIC